MLTAVFAIAVLNLGAGFAVSALADSPWSLAIPALPRRRRSGPQPPRTESLDLATELVTDELPADWIGRLAAAQIIAESTPESVMWIILLETVDAREDFLSIDFGMRNDDAKLADERLKAVGATWLAKLEEWATALEPQKNDPDLGELVGKVEEVLLDQQFRATSAWERLVSGDSEATGEPRLFAELVSTLDAVRDFTSESLGVVLRGQNRADVIEEAWRFDESSGTLSRIGMENLFNNWIRDDAAGNRITSCVLVDVDRTAKFNESIGVAYTDRALATIGELLRNLVRTDRGFDRVVRYRGAAYLLFFGDTAASNAASGAERIRQTMEASSFQLHGTAIDVSATFAVAEMKRKETLTDFLVRLETGIAEAKAAGRNRTFVDSGSGPQPVKLPQYQVERRDIELSEIESLQPADTE